MTMRFSHTYTQLAGASYDPWPLCAQDGHLPREQQVTGCSLTLSQVFSCSTQQLEGDPGSILLPQNG